VTQTTDSRWREVGPDFNVFLLIKQVNVSHFLQKDRGGFELYPHKKNITAHNRYKKVSVAA
jgi:hypothetical protein